MKGSMSGYKLFTHFTPVGVSAPRIHPEGHERPSGVCEALPALLLVLHVTL